MRKEPTYQYVDKMKRTTKLQAQEITQNASEVFHSTDDNRRTMQQSEQCSMQIPSHETTPQGESVPSPHPANSVATQTVHVHVVNLAEHYSHTLEIGESSKGNDDIVFTSLGVRLNYRVVNGRGSLSFTIHGELRHRIESVLPDPNEHAKYAQLYIYDSSAALNERTERNPQLRIDVLDIIQENLLEHNPFARIYHQVYEVLKEASMVTGQDMNIQAHLHYASRIDRRCYNLPSIDEIAVILPGDGHEPCSMKDIILYPKAG
ncbi:hypothetical protein GIB67_017779 [Kingdonia uniflora]|uniref:Helitron helicase-like domain-containing protein n=1 Tax=Kingdonia uniflora TaxID=39325 RepID=A0A7J7MP27_9MAGN|nr:hypothetical protein GIB67_017779 [Kingdonia uniflora]